METKVYNCKNPTENPLPAWMRRMPAESTDAFNAEPQDPVTEFKKNPDAFFPDFVSKN